MPEFEKLQSQIQAARAAMSTASREVAARGEKVRALELRARDVGRRHGKDSRDARAVATEREKAAAAATRAQEERGALRKRHDALYEAFLPFTDPRENLARLPDAAPCLLFPVRLETRFKVITRGRDVRHQLWVRVFPDQCSIDTFDDLLSASEVVRARSYWAGV